MTQTIFVYSGEGTRSRETQARLLKQSPLWARMQEILKSSLNLDLEALWEEKSDLHRCPTSPLLTAVGQICLADLWTHWGYEPDVTVGHSTGELAAAYQAGLYGLKEVLLLAHNIGQVAARRQGRMLHGRLSDSQIQDLEVTLSSFNFHLEGDKHVTVTGSTDEMEAFGLAHPNFAPMQLPHPWHHPGYGQYADQLRPQPSQTIPDGRFLSGVTTGFETGLADDHWRRWLVSPIDFIQTVKALEERYGNQDLTIIEIGFHPVLKNCFSHLSKATQVSSMFRGEDDVAWILHQRRQLDPAPLIAIVKSASRAVKPQLDFQDPLAYQGLGSLELTHLSVELEPYFPTLAPQDFFRHKTINDLLERFAVASQSPQAQPMAVERNPVVVAGMSCRFPATAQTPAQFWEVLLDQTDQVRSETGRGRSAAGFLDDATSRFDHGYFNIPAAEAQTMDPQQILALELTEMLWRDAGIDPQALDRRRVGVYLGVWSHEYQGDRASVYYPTGTNPSIIAARISYHWDLQGPSWVSNTACSSSLVALHYAAKDIEAGRVDYAIAGGVNMLLDEKFTNQMRHSGFLSPDDRCKAFDNTANGYVRAEGGGLLLLANKALVTGHYGEISGSAINQNGRRSAVITAPHAQAQEELITTACADAGIQPTQIDYLECHGTGTKIGDPIEITAIGNTVTKGRETPCPIGSVKSNLGHLESAAGIAGIIKALAALNHGTLPPNLHFGQPNSYIDFEANRVQVVTETTPIDPTARIGVSSFGFGGTNAHVILKGAEKAVRKPIQDQTIPFDRQRSAPLAAYLRLEAPEKIQAPSAATPAKEDGDLRTTIQTIFASLTGVNEIHPDMELVDQGLDSMSAAELINQLEERHQIELAPDFIFEFPLFEQFAAEIERRIQELQAGEQPNAPAPISREAIDALVGDLFFQLTSIPEIDPLMELVDQGLDSMSGAELVSQLETQLQIDIGPEFLFEYPLRDQLVDELALRAGAGLN